MSQTDFVKEIRAIIQQRRRDPIDTLVRYIEAAVRGFSEKAVLTYELCAIVAQELHEKLNDLTSTKFSEFSALEAVICKISRPIKQFSAFYMSLLATLDIKAAHRWFPHLIGCDLASVSSDGASFIMLVGVILCNCANLIRNNSNEHAELISLELNSMLRFIEGNVSMCSRNQSALRRRVHTATHFCLQSFYEIDSPLLSTVTRINVEGFKTAWALLLLIILSSNSCQSHAVEYLECLHGFYFQTAGCGYSNLADYMNPLLTLIDTPFPRMRSSAKRGRKSDSEDLSFLDLGIFLAELHSIFLLKYAQFKYFINLVDANSGANSSKVRCLLRSASVKTVTHCLSRCKGPPVCLWKFSCCLWLGLLNDFHNVDSYSTDLLAAVIVSMRDNVNILHRHVLWQSSTASHRSSVLSQLKLMWIFLLEKYAQQSVETNPEMTDLLSTTLAEIAAQVIETVTFDTSSSVRVCALKDVFPSWLAALSSCSRNVLGKDAIVSLARDIIFACVLKCRDKHSECQTLSMELLLTISRENLTQLLMIEELASFINAVAKLQNLFKGQAQHSEVFQSALTRFMSKVSRAASSTQDGGRAEESRSNQNMLSLENRNLKMARFFSLLNLNTMNSIILNLFLETAALHRYDEF